MAKIEGENHQKTKTPGKNERRSRRGGFVPRQPRRSNHASGGSGSGGSNSRSRPSTPRDKLQSSKNNNDESSSSILSGLKHANEIGMVTAGIAVSKPQASSSIDVEKQVFVPYKATSHNDKSPSRVLPQHASPSRSKQQGRGLPQSKGKQKGSVGKAVSASKSPARRSSKEKNPVVSAWGRKCQIFSIFFFFFQFF